MFIKNRVMGMVSTNKASPAHIVMNEKKCETRNKHLLKLQSRVQREQLGSDQVGDFPWFAGLHPFPSYS